MMIKCWTEIAWEQYLYWQKTDKNILRKINIFVEDISRNKNNGIGKPEALKNQLSGYWSRRITEEHRLVYKIEGEHIYIASCRYHYEYEK